MGGKLMKTQKMLFVVFLIPVFLLFLLLSGSLIASATDSQNELISQIEGALNISVFHEKGTDLLIKCFDVSETGCYAIGNKNNTIYVYDSLGKFQHGYRFDTDGTYGIALKENSIVIYLGRSNIAVEIDPTGKCIDAEKIYFSKDIVDNVMNRTNKQIGNAYYYLERDIGIFNGEYSRLVRIDEMGTKTFLYDVTSRGYFAGVFHYIVLGIFPIASIIFITNKVSKEKRESDG
jgi:hypothetical protein